MRQLAASSTEMHVIVDLQRTGRSEKRRGMDSVLRYEYWSALTALPQNVHDKSIRSPYSLRLCCVVKQSAVGSTCGILCA